jgi:ABC-type transport system involved in cytochrome c biogenesis ATPase subunit
MPHSFKPTAEQHAVVDAVLGGGDLKIKAYAGAGKTSTLRLIADRLASSRGSYLAFNKEIAEHARRGFPPNVSARTVHSLAYASVAPALTAR